MLCAPMCRGRHVPRPRHVAAMLTHMLTHMACACSQAVWPEVWRAVEEGAGGAVAEMEATQQLTEASKAQLAKLCKRIVQVQA